MQKQRKNQNESGRLQVRQGVAERFRERAAMRRSYPSEYLQYLLDMDQSMDLIQLNGSIFDNLFTLLNQAKDLSKQRKNNGFPAQQRWA